MALWWQFTEVAESNNGQEPETGANVERVVESNPTQGVDKKTLEVGEKEADDKAKWIVENPENKDNIQMLKDIREAFDKDSDWKLNYLRSQYDAITNKIMVSYNAAIQDQLRKDKADEDREETMEAKNDVETSGVAPESRENAWDFVEVGELMRNPSLAEHRADEAMKPQPWKMLQQISDIYEVLEKWSEDDKKILNETIKQAQEDLTNLYNKLSWAENNES